MSDCSDYTPTPAPFFPPAGGTPADPGLDVELVGLGCVLDVDGNSLGPVFYEPTFDAETGAYTGSILVHIPNSTGVPVSPYVGPWGPCPSGAATQYVTSTTTYCALIDGVGYSAGDTITVTYIVDPTAIPGPAHVTRYLNISTGPGAPFYLNVDGVDLIGVEPNQTDFGQCSGCTDCADVPAGSVV